MVGRLGYRDEVMRVLGCGGVDVVYWKNRGWVACGWKACG